MLQGFFLRFPEGRAKAVTLSYDDGVKQDIRLIDIMHRNGLKGTFNLNSGLFADEASESTIGRLKASEAKKLYLPSGNEVALHGYEHCYWNHISTATLMYDIAEDKHRLEETFNVPIRGGAYPFGDINDNAVKLLELSGIKYCRTVMKQEVDFGIPSDWLSLKATCHHNDKNLGELTLRFLEIEPNFRRDPYLFYLWGHSYEFDNDDNWNVIETFAAEIGNRKDIWYATNIEIYDYVSAYRSLIFATDGSFVINPTVTDVWISDVKCEKTVKIAANSRTELYI